jgi:hypothetical protein
MQDGLTRAAYWDGGTSAHLDPASPPAPDQTDIRPGFNETPIGLWMIWSGNRLWVSRGNQIFASDIGNPLKFTEAIYLNEGRAFYLSGPCTGMIEVPSDSAGAKGFIAFTEKDGTLFASYIQDRTLWLATPLFQNTILPNVGCVAPRSLTTQYGLNWWFAPRGFTNLNAAFRQNLSSRIDYQDNEMFTSKSYLGPDLSGICASYYENYLMVSVPSGDVLNRHSWVLDQAPMEGNANAWTGFWTGWRPIEWTRGIINGSERVFFGSIDYDGKNRIWEAMLPERTDNGCRITCYAQLRDHAAGDLYQKRYEWTKFFLSQIYGDVDLNIYVASTKGGYQLQKNYRIVATEGQVYADTEYSETGPFLVGNRVQTRTIRTPSDPEPSECNACGVESEEGNMIDYAFTHLLVWSGQMGLRAYQMHMRESPERQTGDCEEPETGPHVLNSMGCSSIDSLFVDGTPFETFTAFAEGNTVTAEGLEVYVRRTAVSPISQENAQAMAECAVDKIIEEFAGSSVPAGVYDATEAEIGSGSYVIVNAGIPAPIPRARVLLVGGGGGGSTGGGGGGQVVELPHVRLDLLATYPVVIGAGGAGVAVTVEGPVGGSGGTTTAFGRSAIGGGGGGKTSNAGAGNGVAGASGGGGGGSDVNTTLGGAGSAGHAGGGNAGFSDEPYPGGGGGGAGAVGGNATDVQHCGPGGDGFFSNISGTNYGYGAGGGGSGYGSIFIGTNYGAGGSSGGGSGGPAGGVGAANSGGGGGGGTGLGSVHGWNGGSGVVYVRYAGPQRFTGGVITTVGNDTVHKFTASGNLAPL